MKSITDKLNDAIDSDRAKLMQVDYVAADHLFKLREILRAVVPLVEKIEEKHDERGGSLCSFCLSLAALETKLDEITKE